MKTSEILLRVPKKTILEILKVLSQIPREELKEIFNDLLEKKEKPPVEEPQILLKKAKPFSPKTSAFFSLPPTDLGRTSAKDIDKIIAEEAYKKG